VETQCIASGTSEGTSIRIFRCPVFVCELSDTQTQYTKTLEDVYAVLAKVETMVDELGRDCRIVFTV